MKKVAGYGRVSTMAQALKGTSPQEQKRKIEEECKHLGHELVKFYSDEGYSGKGMDNRPDLQKLIEDAKAGNFDCVMFTKLDRLGRNLRDLLNIWQLLGEELKLGLHCIDEPAVNTTEGTFGKMMLGMLGVFAEFERALIKERTDSGRKIRWANKESFIGQPPLGYQWDKDTKQIIFNDEQKAIFEKIVSLYLDHHYSMKDIANLLTAEGTLTPSAIQNHKRKAMTWSSAAVSKILKNPAYTGKAIHNRFVFEEGKFDKNYMAASKELKPEEEWIEIDFPPLISEERWNQIQARIEQQKHKPKKGYKDYEDHFLGDGLIYCGECGGRMNKHMRKKTDGTPLFRYRCFWGSCSSKELEMSHRKRCILKPVDAEKIDKRVFLNVLEVLTNPGDFAQKWFKDEDIEELKTRLNNLQKKEKDLKKMLAESLKIVSSAPDTEIRKIYEEERVKYEKDYQTCRKALIECERAHDLAQSKSGRLEEFKKAAKKGIRGGKVRGSVLVYLNRLPFNEKKRLLEAVIAPENGGKCEIKYARAIDVLDDIDNLSNEDLKTPILDVEPMVEMDFKVDLNKIEVLISSLNKSTLFDKFSSDTISW